MELHAKFIVSCAPFEVMSCLLSLQFTQRELILLLLVVVAGQPAW